MGFAIIRTEFHPKHKNSSLIMFMPQSGRDYFGEQSEPNGVYLQKNEIAHNFYACISILCANSIHAGSTNWMTKCLSQIFL